MRTIFLSYHYDERNKAIARDIEQLVESHNLSAFTGDALGGGALTTAITDEIDKADALIALLTRDQQLANGDWMTYPFAPTELQYARGKKIPAIALLETGIKPQGLFQENEYISYDADAPLAAFLKLSRIIWKWQSKAGRQLKLQVTPDLAAQEIWSMQSQCEWQYRLSTGITESEWRPAKARKEPGGLYLYVQVPDDFQMIEVRIKCPVRAWVSDTIPFHMPVVVVGGAV